MEKIPVIVIGGATASGKTALSVELAKEYNAEIVSADSMQIYRYMDIGTAKPTEQEKCGIAHHMIDIVSPDESFSVADYVPRAHEVILDITKRGKNPLVIGGTGLYINSLINDIDFLENDGDEEIRKELFALCQEQGVDVLVEILSEFDPISAQKIHKNNVRRIIRAIEFYKMTGVPISQHQEETRKKESRYSPCMMAIRWDMKKLYERIEKRVDIMLEQGLIDEVKNLIEKGYTVELTSMQGIGYKEIIGYLSGEYSLDEAVEKIKTGTRHYAKRQMTWFRRDERIHWIDYDEDILKRAKEILKMYYTGEC